jgi:hypothetical protein
MTPAEAAGLNIRGWKGLIEAAQKQKVEGNREEQKVLEVVVKV